MPATDLLGERDAWHLLRRAGFGAHATEVARFAGLSRAAAVDELLAVPTTPVKVPARVSVDFAAGESLRIWWLRRMASPRYRLQEKMVLFWHDHFPSALSVISLVDSAAEQNATFRAHALGPFRTLLHQVTRNRAMLDYLDGRRSHKGAVNENYGRELMELFSLGPRDDEGYDNYQQIDVQGMARSLTGFVYADVKKPVVQMSASEFDSLAKVIFYARPYQMSGNLGVENEDGTLFPPATNVLDALFTHRDFTGRSSLARFMVRKLWAWFASPTLGEGLLNDLSAAFINSGYVIGELLRALLTHDAFYTEEARTSTAKTPVDFALQALLALGVKTSWRELPPYLARMGMTLFDPPGVEGWQHGPAWLASSRYLTRMQLAQAFASGRSGKDSFTFKPVVPVGATPTSLVDGALAQLGLEVPSATRELLIAYVSGGEFGSQSWYEMKLRGLYALLLSLPEYQVH